MFDHPQTRLLCSWSTMTKVHNTMEISGSGKRMIVNSMILLLCALSQVLGLDHLFAQPSLKQDSLLSQWKTIIERDTSEFETDRTDPSETTYWIKPLAKQHGPSNLTDPDDQQGGQLDSVILLEKRSIGSRVAILQFYAHGSGIFGSYAIMTYSSQQYHLLAAGGGDHFALTIRDDTLESQTGYPLLDDAQCCPSAHLIQRIVIADTSVLHLPEELRVSEAGAIRQVEAFYDLLNDRAFKTAYSKLSIEYRAKHPYPAWHKGFNKMGSVSAEVSPDSISGRIHVAIESVESNGSNQTTRSFEGSWNLIIERGTNVSQNIYLDDPKIAEQ
jgi:hypothetical protein